MALKAFYGIQTLAGTAQPVFGTAVGAAFTPPPDRFSGNLNPGSNQTLVTVQVASTRGFYAGVEILVGAAASFEPGVVAANAIPDRGAVKSIVDATHLVVQGLTRAHASGEWLVLNEIVGNVQILPVNMAALAYIGEASTVAAGDLSVFDVLNGSLAGYYHDSKSIGISQPFQTSGYWIIGGAGDTFLARYAQV